MEALSNGIDTHLPKLNKNQLISVLTQLGINTEGKPDAIYNKRKLMRWIQKGYHCVKLFKIPWYFCQDILGFGPVSWKILESIFPHSTEKSGEILSRFGLLIFWNIRGIYIRIFLRDFSVFS